MFKQILLGAVLLIGGLILTLATLLKPDESPNTISQAPDTKTKTVNEVATVNNTTEGLPSPLPSPEIEKPVVVEITEDHETGTVDLETETKVLEDKYKDRQLTLEQKTAEANALKAQQEQAREAALRKAEEDAQKDKVAKVEVQTRPESEALAELERIKAENERIAKEKAAAEAKLKALQAQVANAKPATAKTETKPEPKKETPAKPEPVKAEAKKEPAKPEVKAETKKPESKKQETKPEPKETVVPKTYVVQSGDSLIRLSRQYGIPVSAIAELNGMGRNDSLHRGRTIKLPSPKDVKYLEAKALEREKQQAEKQAQEQKRKDINARLVDARREAKRLGVNDGYVVQVALATDQAKADEIVKQYKKAGYAVSTVKEARGVRVIVGSERSKEAAIILKEKINNDPSVSANGAWVLKK